MGALALKDVEDFLSKPIFDNEDGPIIKNVKKALNGDISNLEDGPILKELKKNDWRNKNFNNQECSCERRPEKMEKDKIWADNVEYDTHSYKNIRERVLKEADKCVNGKRQEDYGKPEDNFKIIADLWNVYLENKYDREGTIEVTPMDVSIMMGLLKVGRISSGGGTLDSFIDLAGYAACAGEIWNNENNKKETMND